MSSASAPFPAVFTTGDMNGTSASGETVQLSTYVAAILPVLIDLRDATLDQPRLKLITAVMITGIDLANSANPPTAAEMTAAVHPARIQYNNMSKQDQDMWVASYVVATNNFPGLSAVGVEGGGGVPHGMECLAELYNVYEASKAPIQLTPELKKTVKAVKCVMVSLLSGKTLKVKKQRSPKASLQQTRTPPLPSQTPTVSNTGTVLPNFLSDFSPACLQVSPSH
ncbi:hypothetical protein HaLaN_32405 [Haematococcus lacustris]|uniref:Uncharacterized protein n=1 Tax=Haematococcus lacustris TaxID=44745 RepID=A0A6A0AMT0_HAELA|nr:hypothetical protein HaLaN_32405 [Haematococcus lacustris]